MTALVKPIFCQARTSTGLKDENQKSCCTWNWWVLSGNNMHHLTVHWLSIIIRRCNHKNNYLVYKNTKTWSWNTQTCR